MPASDLIDREPHDGAKSPSPSPSPPKTYSSRKKKKKSKRIAGTAFDDLVDNEAEVSKNEPAVAPAKQETVDAEEDDLVPVDLQVEEPPQYLLDELASEMILEKPGESGKPSMPDDSPRPSPDLVPEQLLVEVNHPEPEQIVEQFPTRPIQDTDGKRSAIPSGPFDAVRSSSSNVPAPSAKQADRAKQATLPRSHTQPVRDTPVHHTPQATNGPPQDLIQPHFLSSIHNHQFYANAKKTRPANRWWTETCYQFDSFSSSGDTVSALKVKDALLVGGDGSLDVYRVLPNKMEVVGRLEGLGGLVVNAKVLPAVTEIEEESSQVPLVAVVLHVAVVDSATADLKLQAIVQVYSLRNQKCLSTLFTSLATPAPQPGSDLAVRPPELLGGLRLRAAGAYITVASTASGEVHVFHHRLNNEINHEFRCIAKFWTSLSTKPSMPTSSAKDVVDDSDHIHIQPLLALGNRWLVISCPSTSSRISVQGTPLMSASHIPFGVGSHNPPMQPPITAETSAMNAEGVVSRYTRQAAQELLKASRKGIELGLAGWREFTSPTQPDKSTAQPKPDNDTAAFPPTHAPADTLHRAEQEPAILSVIDLDKFVSLSASNSKPQVPFAATFAIEDGCNYLSLSSDGLSLLTANRTGEVSAVWSLGHIFYSSVSFADDDNDFEVEGPYVQCTYRMQRNSPCSVTNAVWSHSDSELAIQTANGTTHLHHLPMNDSRSPNTRELSTRRDRSDSKSGIALKASPGSSPPVPGVFDSLRSGWQSVSTQVSSIRSSATTAQPFDISSTFAGLRATSGRVLARGLASGYSAAKTGVGDLWHADDNKIRNGDASLVASLRWMQTADGICFVTVQDGKVAVHTILRIARMRGRSEFLGLKVEKGSRMEFILPAPSTPSSTEACSIEGPHGFWSLRSLPVTTNAQRQRQHVDDTYEEDVITNPLYCPFHVDPRVSMIAYTPEGEAQQQEQTRPADNTFWCFGEPLIPGVKMNSDHTGLPDAVDFDGAADAMYESRVTVHPVSQEIEVRSHRIEGTDANMLDKGEQGWNDRFDD